MNIYSQHKLVHCQIIHVIPIKLKLIEENHQIRLKLLFFFSFHLKEKEKPNIKRKRVHQPTLIKFINFLFKLQTYLFTTNLTQSLIPFRTRFSFTQLLELILPLTYHVSHRLTSIFFDALPPSPFPQSCLGLINLPLPSIVAIVHCPPYRGSRRFIYRGQIPLSFSRYEKMQMRRESSRSSSGICIIYSLYIFEGRSRHNRYNVANNGCRGGKGRRTDTFN